MSADTPSKAIIDTPISDEMHTIRRQTLDLETATEEDIRGFLAGPNVSFKAALDDALARLTSDLVAEGWPDPTSVVLGNERGWRMCPPDLVGTHSSWQEHVLPGEQIRPGWAHTLKLAAPFSPPWFRAKLCRLIIDIRNSKGEQRDMHIFTFGHTWAVAQSRMYERKIKRSNKIQKAVSEGGKARARNMAQDKAETLSEMRKLVNEGKNVSEAARIAAGRGKGTNPKANRALWYRSRSS